MTKFTIRQLIPMVESIDALLNVKLPAKECYNLSLAANIMREKFDAYERERQELVKKYGEYVEAENVIRVPTQNMEQFQVALAGIMDQVIELPIEPISIDSLGDYKMTAKDMAILTAFFRP